MRYIQLNKIICIIFILLLIVSCLEFHPLYKYDSDPFPVNVNWYIDDNGGGAFYLYEIHPDAQSATDIFFDGTIFDIAGNGYTEGRFPDFRIQPSMSEQASFYTLWEFFDIFLCPFSLNGSGTKDSLGMPEYQGLDHFVTSYNSYITTYSEVPFPADIHGTKVEGFIDSSQFPTPGNLSVVEFNTVSNDLYMSGEGKVIFHSGYPNGIVYFYFKHDSGFTTYIYQWSGGSSSTGSYFGAMNGDYRWIMFPH